MSDRHRGHAVRRDGDAADSHKELARLQDGLERRD